MDEAKDLHGMTMRNYDPEIDMEVAGGGIGIALVDRVLMARKRREEEAILEREVYNQERGLPACGLPRKGSREYWEKVTRVAMIPFSAREVGEPSSPREIKRRLAKLRGTGYKIAKYGKMEAWQLRRYFGEVYRAVIKEAKIKCPELVREMNEFEDQIESDRERDR